MLRIDVAPEDRAELVTRQAAIAAMATAHAALAHEAVARLSAHLDMKLKARSLARGRWNPAGAPAWRRLGARWGSQARSATMNEFWRGTELFA